MKIKRKFSAELKAKIALSVIDGSKTALEIGREYDIGPNLIHRWKDQLISQASGVFVTKIEDKEEAKKIKKYEYVHIRNMRNIYWNTLEKSY